MKIIDVHRFNRKFQMLNEWSNFKHKIEYIVNKLIKLLVLNIKNENPHYKSLTSRETLVSIFYNSRKNEKSIHFEISHDNFLNGFTFDFVMYSPNDIIEEKFKGKYFKDKIEIIVPNFSSLKEFCDYTSSDNFFEDMYSVLNHEISHHMDKKLNLNNNYDDSFSSSLEDILYYIQEREIRASLQEMMPKLKNNSSILDSLKNKVEKDFKDNIIKDDFLNHYLKCCVSYTFFDKTLKDRYWKFFTNEEDIKNYLVNYDDIDKFNRGLIYLVSLIKKLKNEGIIKIKNKKYTLFGYKNIPSFENIMNNFYSSIKNDFRNLNYETMINVFREIMKYYIEIFRNIKNKLFL